MAKRYDVHVTVGRVYTIDADSEREAEDTITDMVTHDANGWSVVGIEAEERKED